MKHATSTPPAEPAASPPVAAMGHCENCGAPLYGKYCYACGQPIQGLVRHFSSVMSDVADSLLNVDERLFRTVGPLYLRPGKLTLDYFAGRRARYVTPFRLVFFLAIIAFFGVQLTVRSGTVQPPEQVRTTTTSPAGGASVSLVPTPKEGGSKSDDGVFAHGSITINDKTIWNRDTKPLKVAWLPDALNTWLNDLMGNAQQQLHAMNSGSFGSKAEARRKFTLGMFSAAPTVLFILLPVFALLLKIFYIFKRRLYMEHLIVAMHSHAFLMLSMLVLLVLRLLRAWFAPHGGWAALPFRLLETAAWIWIFVYLWLMQKRVYRQGWFMTNVKYWSLGLCYTIMAGFGFVFAVLLSLTSA
ncbi:MAG TPA: DUF3667 domain-containing protein [Rhodanobacteraceae bacterium]